MIKKLSLVNIRFLPAGIALALFGGSLFAIPQNFNQGGFFLNTGVTFENFAADNATWADGAQLPGTWSAPDAKGARKLKEDAVVLGLPAAEITAQRINGRVTAMRVFFRDKERKSRPLFDRINDNIRAFTGEPGKASGTAGRVFRHARVQIIARQISAGEVVVEFTPLA